MGRKVRRIEQWAFIVLLCGVLVCIGLLLWRSPRVRQLLNNQFWVKSIRRRQSMRPGPENNSISTGTQNALPSGPSTASPPTTSSTPTPSTNVTPERIEAPLPQQRPSGIYGLFHPPTPFPVKARRVVVYALWRHAPGIPTTLTLPANVHRFEEKLGPWHTTHFVWKLSADSSAKAWIEKDEAIEALKTMREYVDKLADSQGNNQGNTQLARLIYKIFYIRELKLEVPHLYRLRISRLHYHMSKEELQQGKINTRRGFVQSLQKCFQLSEEEPFSGIVPNTFEHYDRTTHSKGWIILNPVQALLVGVDDSDIRILIGLLQRQDVDLRQQHIGIRPERYDDVLGRVSLWNAARDINETIDQVADLASSGQKAVDGQVLITLTLAVIGILVSLDTKLNFSTIHLWGTYGLLALASIFFWQHAHGGKRFWLHLGVVSLVCTALLNAIPI